MFAKLLSLLKKTLPWRTFEVSIQHSDGLERSRFFRAQSGLHLEGFLTTALGGGSLSSVTSSDFSDSSIQIQVNHGSLTCSFPSTHEFFVDGQSVSAASAIPLPSQPLRRTTMAHPLPCESLSFRFPNGSKLAVKIHDASFEDFKSRLQEASPFSLVIVGHAVVLFLMTLSFSLPSTALKRPEVVDVSQVQVSLINGASGQLVGSTTLVTGPVTQETLALRRALKKLDLKDKKNKFTATSKFAGFSSRGDSVVSPENSRNSNRIGFSGPGEEAPDLNLSAQQVSAVFDSVNLQLKECYDDVLVRDSSLQGRPQVVVQVTSHGVVEDVGINYLQGKAQALGLLRDCFRQAFRAVKFPRANQSFAVTQTLVLVR